MQVVIFRIICHIRLISSRHRQIPCVRHTAEREGSVLPDGLRAGVGTRPYIQAPQDTPPETEPRKCRGGLYGRPRAGTSPAPTDKRHKTTHRKQNPGNVGAAFMAACGRGQAPPLRIILDGAEVETGGSPALPGSPLFIQTRSRRTCPRPAGYPWFPPRRCPSRGTPGRSQTPRRRFPPAHSLSLIHI